MRSERLNLAMFGSIEQAELRPSPADDGGLRAHAERVLTT
jgi:hypothetical protein